MKVFRVDVYAKWNADMLISRNYVSFQTEAEAYEYGNSIANGNNVNVVLVRSRAGERAIKTLLNNVRAALLDGKIKRKDDWTAEFDNGYVLSGYRWKNDIEADTICLANALKTHKEMFIGYDYVMKLYK